MGIKSLDQYKCLHGHLNVFIIIIVLLSSVQFVYLLYSPGTYKGILFKCACIYVFRFIAWFSFLYSYATIELIISSPSVLFLLLMQFLLNCSTEFLENLYLIKTCDMLILKNFWINFSFEHAATFNILNKCWNYELYAHSFTI